MSEGIQFETPENVKVQYTPAGLGTRFLAWFVDQFFATVFMMLVLIAFIIIGVSYSEVLEDFVEKNSNSPERFGQILIGLAIMVMGLGSFFYFICFELFMRGQTPGKRIFKIRVVKLDGFALDSGSILLRSVFRLVDHLPLLWIVPFMSKRSQRAGDMVAGTVVITDVTPELSAIRVKLSDRKAVEAEFRFDSRALGRLTEVDILAVEELLERWGGLPPAQRDQLAQKMTNSLAIRLQMEKPADNRRQQFLEDLLAAELRRQNRLLA